MTEHRICDAASQSSEDAWLLEAAALPRAAAGSKAALPGDTWLGGRFALQRRIGHGGMGVVFAALDRQHRAQVALKTLARLGPQQIYRLKNEFRSLANVVHPNLVLLHELHCDGDAWFLTMELVHGRHFDHALAGADVSQLRKRFAQLADGLAAIHAAHKLHRDLKPSNVLVTQEGRVVIVDFGLVSEQQAGGAGITRSSDLFSGTPQYMSPEQARGEAVSPASDCYALGLMLYEALAKRVAFTGSARHVLERKQAACLPDPAPLAHVPEDLRALCLELLAAEPRVRPDAAAIRERVSLAQRVELAARAAPQRVFVGRHAELAALRAAFDRAAAGSCACVTLSGESGIGKSALVEELLRQLYAHPQRPLLLRGRCHPREHVPFKAFDAVIDAVARHLRSLPAERAAQLLPRDTPALAQMFPALACVEVVANARGRRSADLDLDAQELRRRAFAAFKALFVKLSDAQPLVVHIDDLHWGDADSARLLTELLSPPDPPALLLIAGHRSHVDNPCIAALSAASAVDTLRLELGALSHAETAQLLAAQLPTPNALSEELVQRCHDEAQGVPFLLWELCHAQPDQAWPSLAQVLDARISQLGATQRTLLDTLAAAARPLAWALLEAAAGTPDVSSSLERLRAQRFVRVLERDGVEHVELYHDRVRETWFAGMSQQARRERFSALARAFETLQPDADEASVEYRTAAGELEAAAVRCQDAARRAMRALAFERAALLFGRALSLPQPTAARLGLLQERAQACANAGDCMGAAEAYLAVAALQQGPERMQTECRAAFQCLISGHEAQGMALLRALLRELGCSFPETPGSALASLLLHRLRLRVRGLSFRARSEAELDGYVLAQLDALGVAAVGLSMNDNIRGADFATRYLLAALSVGEVSRVARALAAEAAFLGREGGRNAPRTAALLSQARELDRASGSASTLASIETASGMAAACRGAWREGRDHCELALSLLRAQPQAAPWDYTTAQLFLSLARFNLGELGALSRDVTAAFEQAQRSGNLYLSAAMSGGSSTLACLVTHDVEEAERRLITARAARSGGGYHLQDAMLELGECMIAAYVQDEKRALRVSTQLVARMRAAQLHRVPSLYAPALHAQASAALCLAGRDTRSPELLDLARTATRRLSRLSITSAAPLALQLRAGLAWQSGDVRAAVSYLEQAVRTFDAAAMPLFAASARRCSAQLQGSSRSDLAVREVELRLYEQAVVCPDRICAVFLSWHVDHSA